MRTYNRRQTPKVTAGATQKKNNWEYSPEYPVTPGGLPAVIRERPGAGYKHLVLKSDIERFVRLLPDWNRLSENLQAIRLAEGNERYQGWSRVGEVALCAWPRSIVDEYSEEFLTDHIAVFRQLGIPHEPVEDGVRILFTEQSARAFQLVHVLIHEFGHHYDRMTTKSQWDCARGEPFAERYAITYGNLIWQRYVEEFRYY